MRVIIQKGDKKREILGPFNFCGSRKDLRKIAKALRKMPKKASYGWVKIGEEPFSIGTKPEPWE